MKNPSPTIQELIDENNLLHERIKELEQSEAMLKQTEEKLRKSERKLEQAQYIAGIGDFTWDISSGAVSWSDGMYKLLKYDKNEDIDFSKVNAAIHHPDDLERVTKWLMDSIASGVELITPNEYRLICKDGQIINVQTNGKIEYQDGKAVKLFGTCLNITKRKQSEKALADSLQRLNEAQRIASIGNWMLDLRTNELIWSDEIYRIFEIDKDKFGESYDSFLSLIHPEDREKVDKAYSGSLIQKKPYEITHRLLMSDGRVKYVIENCHTDYDENGNPVKSIGTIQDITKAKLMEEEKEKLQAQLFQSQKMESIGRLAGGVAHDFNNMLGVILGHTEMIMTEVDTSLQIYTDLEEIRLAAKRSADLTRQLLGFARKQLVTPKVLDLNQTIGSLFKMLTRLIGEDINMIWLPTEEPAMVKIDPTQVNQILTNLCINARDAIFDVGKITIETGKAVFDKDYCSQHSGFMPGEFILLAVSDDGCGMSQELQSEVFEPFFTTKEMGKGTGLGLSTIYGIVTQNQGFINIYSEPGQGTTFKIYLPRHVGKTNRLTEKAATLPHISSRKTILLVEDEPSNLNLFTLMLEKQGYTVVAAGTPVEAIRLAEDFTGRFDLLLTDVVMPEMNGRDLAKKILTLYPTLKRLFMSGYTANVIAHQGVLEEGVNFIQKPFSVNDLINKIHQILEAK